MSVQSKTDEAGFKQAAEVRTRRTLTCPSSGNGMDRLTATNTGWERVMPHAKGQLEHPMGWAGEAMGRWRLTHPQAGMYQSCHVLAQHVRY